MDFAAKLDKNLPAGRLALLHAAAQAADQHDFPLYIVGGVVRDLLLGHAELDLDLVVEGDAITLGNSLVGQYGGSLTAHRRFGTAKWHIAKHKPALAEKLGGAEINIADIHVADIPDSLDLISARRETYQAPAALPTVTFSAIQDDLHRRDFTINTLAIRLDGEHYGELIDLLGGRADLEKGLIRVLHADSFKDDPTRMLRAVRFEQRFGYQLEAQTLAWLIACLPWIEEVSGDRLRHELDAILIEENYAEMLARLAELGVLQAIYGKLNWDAPTQQRVALAQQAQPNPDWGLEDKLEGYALETALMYILWFIDLPKTEAAHLMGRLMIPGWLTKMVLRACDHCDQETVLQNGQPSQIADRLEHIPALTIFAHSLHADNPKAKDNLRAYLDEWRHVKPLTDGHALRAQGLPPGPRYREILDALRDAWLDGEVASAEDEQALLERLLHD